MCDARILVTAIVDVPLERISTTKAFLAELARVARRVRGVVGFKVALAIVCAGEGLGTFFAWEPLYAPWCARRDSDCGLTMGSLLRVIELRRERLLGLHRRVVIGVCRVHRLLRLALVLGVVLTDLGIPLVFLSTMLHTSRSRGWEYNPLRGRVLCCPCFQSFSGTLLTYKE